MVANPNARAKTVEVSGMVIVRAKGRLYSDTGVQRGNNMFISNIYPILSQPYTHQFQSQATNSQSVILHLPLPSVFLDQLSFLDHLSKPYFIHTQSYKHRAARLMYH